jgi:hypothetical protein
MPEIPFGDNKPCTLSTGESNQLTTIYCLISRTGHCHLQSGPLRPETGQYQNTPLRNRLDPSLIQIKSAHSLETQLNRIASPRQKFGFQTDTPNLGTGLFPNAVASFGNGSGLI